MENKLIQDFFGTNPSYLIGYATEPQRLISLNQQDHIRARQRVGVAITAYLLQIILELNSAEREESFFRLVAHPSFTAWKLTVEKGNRGRKVVLVR